MRQPLFSHSRSFVFSGVLGVLGLLGLLGALGTLGCGRDASPSKSSAKGVESAEHGAKSSGTKKPEKHEKNAVAYVRGTVLAHLPTTCKLASVYVDFDALGRAVGEGDGDAKHEAEAVHVLEGRLASLFKGIGGEQADALVKLARDAGVQKGRLREVATCVNGPNDAVVALGGDFGGADVAGKLTKANAKAKSITLALVRPDVLVAVAGPTKLSELTEPHEVATAKGRLVTVHEAVTDDGLDGVSLELTAEGEGVALVLLGTRAAKGDATKAGATFGAGLEHVATSLKLGPAAGGELEEEQLTIDSAKVVATVRLSRKHLRESLGAMAAASDAILTTLGAREPKQHFISDCDYGE